MSIKMITNVQEIVWERSKSFAKAVLFHEGKFRRVLIGPYSGIVFKNCSQMKSRMQVFYKAYEPGVSKLLATKIQSGMTIFDVGAHVGIHALFAGKLLKGSGTVFAFEAWPQNYQVLQQNITANLHLSVPIKAVNIAIGNDNGVVGFSMGITDGMHHLALTGEKRAIEVAINSLETIVIQYDVMPDLILVDVEGAELQVLEGAATILDYKKPKLILEHHGNQNELTKFLQQFNYETTMFDRHIYAE